MTGCKSGVSGTVGSHFFVFVDNLGLWGKKEGKEKSEGLLRRKKGGFKKKSVLRLRHHGISISRITPFSVPRRGLLRLQNTHGLPHSYA